MKAQLSEFPKHPLPDMPRPQQPQRPHVQQPTVYVYERQTWEYKVVTRMTAEDTLPSEEDLNALGISGWELVGVVALPDRVQFYLKRART